jgi:hypothetical protein
MSEIESKSDVLSSPGTNNRLVSLGLPIVAALITWMVVYSMHPMFRVGSEFDIGMGAATEQRLALLAEQDRIDRWNTVVILSLGGVLMAGALTMSSTSCCSLAKRMLFSLPMGGIAGMGAGFLGATLFSKIVHRDSFPDTTNTGLAHATVFGIFGLLMGLIYGVFTRDVGKIVLASILGGLAGAAGGLLFPITTGLVMPQIDITGLIQPSIAGILWLILPFVAIGYAVPNLTNRRHPAVRND